MVNEIVELSQNDFQMEADNLSVAPFLRSEHSSKHISKVVGKSFHLDLI